MPQIADRKSMARYICVDKGATHPALQREELPKHMAIYRGCTDRRFQEKHGSVATILH